MLRRQIGLSAGRRQTQLVLSLLVFFLISVPSHARITDPRPYGPLKVRTQNPLYQQFITLPIESAQTLNAHQFETEIQTTHSNVFELEIVGQTQLRFDMEQWRTIFTMGYGITDNLDVKIELPFVNSTAGFLDGFVQWYHNLFGLPNGGREFFPNYEYRFELSQNGTQLFSHSASGFGPADMLVRSKYLLPFDWPVKVALVPTIKIPTGKITSGLSSGNFDLGGHILVEKNLRRFHFVSQLGGAWISGHDHLDPILKNYFIQFGQSAEWQIADGVSLIAELTGNTPLFKNVSADELSTILLDLNVGFAGSFPLEHPYLDELYYQFSFGEDLIGTGPSVDFATLFLVGVRY